MDAIALGHNVLKHSQLSNPYRTNGFHSQQSCTYVLQAILGVLLFLLTASASPTEPTAKNVLVLFSSVQYSEGFLDVVEPAVRTRVPGPINFYDAYLDDPHVEQKAYRDSQAETFRRRYAAVKLDLVIANNPAAFQFAVQYRDKIFPGVPIVFNAVAERDLDGQKMWPQGVTGVAPPLGFQETIDFALRLQPDTKAVAVVSGITTWDQRFLAIARSELLRHQDKVTEIELVGAVNDHQILERIVALPPHTVVLFQAYPQFSNQPEFGTWDLLTEVAQRMPTYSVFPRLCSNGCIGGAYEDVPKETLLVAEMAARILTGARPEDIPIVHPTALQFRVDWRALQRWNIPAAVLPPGTLVLNREATLWERGRKYFVAAIAIILFQAVSILALFWQRARKRRAEAELTRSEEKFAKTFRQSPLVLAISTASDSRFIDVNESFEKQLGWKRDEVIGRTPLDLHLWPNADQRAAFVGAIQANGSVQDFEALARCRNGEIRTFLVSAEVLDVAGQSCTLSVAADITERKKAEDVLSTMSRRLIEAQEEERAWIARELHDDINQRVAMVSFCLENMTRDLPSSNLQARRQLDETKQQMKDLGVDIHALSHRLHSSKLDILGLASACRGFCSELSKQHNVEIEFYSDNIPTNLSKEISLCLFRVSQEALQNAVKYSGVRKFQVSLKGTSDQVELTVQDSGAGFNSEKAINGHGLGLSSMKERLKLVDGQFFIDSKPGLGTTIHARVALSPKTMASEENGLGELVP